ncbi:MAG: hypothetical protein PHQ09_07265 [Actinomycetota bacterium]|nr:hypothetical protein [Actinomycetota bacterium]
MVGQTKKPIEEILKDKVNTLNVTDNQSAVIMRYPSPGIRLLAKE